MSERTERPKPSAAQARASEPVNDLSAARARFEAHLPAKLRRPDFETPSGIPIPPVFLPVPGSEGAYVERLGFPGQAPSAAVRW